MDGAVDGRRTDSSGYVFGTGLPREFIPENMPSDVFRNISPVGDDRKGPFRLLSATRYGKRYLLKCLSADYSRDPVYSMIQMKEFEIGVTLDHPHIRRTFGFEEVGNFGVALILEYVDGEPLDRALEDGRITSANARGVVAQLASALEYIHSRQICHRDIKPSNILVTYSGAQIKLIDFSLSDSGAYVILKSPAGTKRYLAPEQMHVDAKPTVRADIYSFGMVVAEIAEKVGDRELMRVARVCADEDPECRPECMSQIRLPELPDITRKRDAGVLDSKMLTWFLMSLATLLLFVVSWLLYQGHDASAADDGNDGGASGIEVVDMNDIKKERND